MGKFFNTLHVKSSNREAFIKGFEWIMKNEGFVPCDNEEADVTFAAAFSEGGWASLSNGEPSADGLARLSERLAKDLLLPSFTVEAVDSDFAILELLVPDKKKTKFRKSSLVVGNGEGYGVEKAPILLDDWKPLLQNGGVEKFLAVIGKDSVFVEDDLAELGSLLGISSYAMTADCDELSGNEGAFELSFKKAAEKKLTLNAAFKQVFGEALEPYGFKEIKYKYPCFARIMEDEIVQIITYVKRKGHPCVNGYVREDCSQYDIVCKVETVYSTEIELPTKNFEKYSGYLSKWDIYVKGHIADYDKDYLNKVSDYFPYKPEDEKLTIGGLEDAIDLTKQILLPVLDSVTDLKSYLEFYFKFKGEPFLDYKPGHYEHLNEYVGLLRLKVETWESFLKRNEGYVLRGYDISDERNKRSLANNPERLVQFLEKVDKKRQEYLSEHEERESLTKQMFGDKEWCEKAFEELERRRKENTERLKEYGLEI